MMLNRFSWTIAACLCALVFAAPAHARPTPGLQLLTLDPGTSHAQIDRALNSAKALGAPLVRTELSWASAEPQQGQFDENYLSIVKYFVDAATQRGIKTVMLIQGSPCWASAADDKSGCHDNVTPDSVIGWEPTDPSSVSGIFGVAAQRFGSELAAIEVWNEPDQSNQFYFKGPDKAIHYAALLKAAYTAVKAADPNLTVLGGAIVGSNGRFLQALYDQGIKGYYDALSVHYYDTTLGSLRAVHATMLKNGDSSPVWVGEFGADSCGPKLKSQGGQFCFTRKIQSKILHDVFAGLRNTSWVKAVLVYTLDDSPTYQFGLKDMRGKAKPAYFTMKKIFHGQVGTLRKPTLHLKRRNGQVFASGTSPAGDDLALTVYVHGQKRLEGGIHLSRNQQFNVGLPAALGTSGVRVTIYQYWDHRLVSRRI